MNLKWRNLYIWAIHDNGAHTTFGRASPLRELLGELLLLLPLILFGGLFPWRFKPRRKLWGGSKKHREWVLWKGASHYDDAGGTHAIASAFWRRARTTVSFLYCCVWFTAAAASRCSDFLVIGFGVKLLGRFLYLLSFIFPPNGSHCVRVVFCFCLTVVSDSCHLNGCSNYLIDL